MNISKNTARFGLIVSTFLYSTDALLIRMAGSFTAVPFYRALFAAISLFALFFLSKKNMIKCFKEGGGALMLSIFMMSIAGLSFSFAVQIAGAAIPLVYLAIAPLIASILSFLFLKEKPTVVTVIAIFISIFGIFYMNKDGSGEALLLGHILSILPPLVLSINFVNLRMHKDFDRRLICASGNILAAIYGLFIAKGDIALPLSSILPMLLLGLVVVPFGQVAMNTATKFLPAFEVSLINSLEGILGLIWIFLILKELPTSAEMIGGAIVFGAIILNSAQDFFTHKE